MCQLLSLPPQPQGARPLDASRFPARFRSYRHLCRSSREVDSRWIIGGSGVRISHKYKRDKEVIPKFCWTSHSFNMFQRDLETLDVLNVVGQPENDYLWFIFRYVYIYIHLASITYFFWVARKKHVFDNNPLFSIEAFGYGKLRAKNKRIIQKPGFLILHPKEVG